jgi:hypothetical protein
MALGVEETMVGYNGLVERVFVMAALLLWVLLSG